MTAMDGINLVIALTGVVLATVALWHQFHQTRVRLRVIPRFTAILPNGAFYSSPKSDLERIAAKSREVGWTIEVVNLSAFPVTIAEIGFGKVGHLRRSVIIKPIVISGKEFPTRLESREAVRFFLWADSTPGRATVGFPYAFATTDCDVTTYGTSPALRRWLGKLAEAAEVVEAAEATRESKAS